MTLSIQNKETGKYVVIIVLYRYVNYIDSW